MGGRWQPPLPPGSMPPLLPNAGPQQALHGQGQQPPPGPRQPLPLGPPPPVYGAQQGPVPGPPLQPQGGQPAVPPGLAQAPPGQPLPQKPVLTPVLQQLLAALGVPAPAVSPAAPAAQVAVAARRIGGETRGSRERLDSTEAMRSIHDKMDGKATRPIYKGTSEAKLSIHNNPVLFQDKVARVLRNADTADGPTVSGLSHLRPELDRMTPLRRKLLEELIGEDLCTHIELTSSGIVEVPTIDGLFA